MTNQEKLAAALGEKDGYVLSGGVPGRAAGGENHRLRVGRELHVLEVEARARRRIGGKLSDLGPGLGIAEID